jgi:RHS repeat-associated protein
MRTLQFSTFRILRAFAICATLLGSRGLAATGDNDAVPAAPPDKFTYIVVLHDRAPNNGPELPAEPDIAGMGGEVVERWQNRRVIRISEPGLRALVAHRAVKYIQRMQAEASIPPPTRSPSVAATGMIEAAWAPPAWSSGVYTYDGEGNITSIGPGSDGGTDSFTYDSAGRLVKAVTTHDGTHSERYSYDSFGNLLNTTRTAGLSTATPANPATNRLQGVGYDAAGNVVLHQGGTTEYIYDAFNMLRAKNSSTGAARYIYTADDERIGVQENGETRWMIRDLSGKVLREWEGTHTWIWVEDYIHRDGALTAADREPAEGGTRHFHLDHLGTPRLITDATGTKIAFHDYFPFGVEQTDFRQEMFDRGTDRPEPMKFTGHERDFTAGVETNNRNQLDYMHARYYSPVWGRFLSVDPKNRRLPLRQPQLYNRYAYALNNPLNFVDLDGEDVTPVRLLMTGGKPKIAYIDGRMVPRLQNLVTTAHKQGVSFTFSSLLRTQDQQDGIKTSNTKNNKGTSPHTAGLAIDINVKSSLQGTDLAGLTTIARGADLSPLNNQDADPPHFQANDLITRDKKGKVDDQFKALVEENQQQTQDYEKLRKEDPEKFEKDVVDILPPP